MARFGTFTFGADEEPVSDTGWVGPALTADITLPLGAVQESIVLMGVGLYGPVGSARRTLEFYLTVARFAVLEALLNTVDAFEDWEVVVPFGPPYGKIALLSACECIDAVTGWYGSTSARRRVRIELIEQ